MFWEKSATENLINITYFPKMKVIYLTRSSTWLGQIVYIFAFVQWFSDFGLYYLEDTHRLLPYSHPRSGVGPENSFLAGSQETMMLLVWESLL